MEGSGVPIRYTKGADLIVYEGNIIVSQLVKLEELLGVWECP